MTEASNRPPAADAEARRAARRAWNGTLLFAAAGAVCAGWATGWGAVDGDASALLVAAAIGTFTALQLLGGGAYRSAAARCSTLSLAIVFPWVVALAVARRSQGIAPMDADAWTGLIVLPAASILIATAVGSSLVYLRGRLAGRTAGTPSARPALLLSATYRASLRRAAWIGVPLFLAWIAVRLALVRGLRGSVDLGLFEMMDRQNLLVRWMGAADLFAGATLLADLVWLTRRAWAARASSPSDNG